MASVRIFPCHPRAGRMCRIAFRISTDWNRWATICRESRESIIKIRYPQIIQASQRVSGDQEGRQNTLLPQGFRGLAKRALHDIRQVTRQVWRSLDALQRGLRLGAAAGFQRAPSAKRGGKPRRNLRIFWIQRSEE